MHRVKPSIRPFLAQHLPAMLAFAFLAGYAHAAAPSDADFIAAKIAFERGDWRRLDALAPAVAGHPLERYVQYWQLKSRLDDSSSDAVRAFLDRHAGRSAHRSAARRLAEGARQARRLEPLCARLSAAVRRRRRARLLRDPVSDRRDGEDALAAAKPLWFTGQSTPDACEPLFAALIARGDLSIADRRTRLRLANAAGNMRLVRAIADELPGKERITLREFAAVERDPLRALDQGTVCVEDAVRARARPLRARARRAQGCRRRARWRGSSGAARLPEADRDYGNLRIA